MVLLLLRLREEVAAVSNEGEDEDVVVIAAAGDEDEAIAEIAAMAEDEETPTIHAEKSWEGMPTAPSANPTPFRTAIILPLRQSRNSMACQANLLRRKERFWRPLKRLHLQRISLEGISSNIMLLRYSNNRLLLLGIRRNSNNSSRVRIRHSRCREVRISIRRFLDSCRANRANMDSRRAGRDSSNKRHSNRRHMGIRRGEVSNSSNTRKLSSSIRRLSNNIKRMEDREDTDSKANREWSRRTLRRF